MQSCLVLIAGIHATSLRYRTKINMCVDDFLGFNVQGHLQGQNDRKILPNAQNRVFSNRTWQMLVVRTGTHVTSIRYKIKISMSIDATQPLPFRVIFKVNWKEKCPKIDYFSTEFDKVWWW